MFLYHRCDFFDLLFTTTILLLFSICKLRIYRIVFILQYDRAPIHVLAAATQIVRFPITPFQVSLVIMHGTFTQKLNTGIYVVGCLMRLPTLEVTCQPL